MSKKKGFVYLVGAGLGASDLMTLRAYDRLARADVILYDRLISPDILAKASPKARLIYVGKKASYHSLAQDGIEDILVAEAKKGNVVVRLKGGDPYIFGRGGEEAQRLVEEGIDFEVVPGISSALAAPLFAGIPLTHRQFTPSIAIVTGHENPDKEGALPYRSGVEREASRWIHWPSLAGMGTIVFLMGVGNLRANMKKLMENGKIPQTPVAIVRWAGLGKQKTLLGTVSTIADKVQNAKMTSPAVVVVGDVVGLSPALNFFERGIFYGKTFLLTRDAASNRDLQKNLEEKSAHVLSWPSFSYHEVRSHLDKMNLQSLKKIDWLIFTSVAAVDFFIKKYQRVYSDWRPLMTVKIAAVGEKTASRLKDMGLWVDVKPKKQSAQALALLSAFTKKRGLKILVPQAQDAMTDFYDFHKDRHDLCLWTVYCKKSIRQPDEVIHKISEKKVDWILFFSPSSLDAFMANFFSQKDALKILSRSQIAVIGTTTAKHLNSFGISCAVIAKKPQIDQLIHQIETALR